MAKSAKNPLAEAVLAAADDGDALAAQVSRDVHQERQELEQEVG